MPSLRLSALGFDVVLALGSNPDGLRLAEIASAIVSPVSSVQRVLGTLAGNGLVSRNEGQLRIHRLAPEHPAREELLRLAAVLPEPAHAIGIVLRANPSVRFASYDGLGFVAAIDDGREAAVGVLDEQLDAIANARPSTPPILRIPAQDLARLTDVMPGLRLRLTTGLLVKGNLPSASSRGTGARARRRAG